MRPTHSVAMVLLWWILLVCSGCGAPPQGGTTLESAKLITIEVFEQLTKHEDKVEFLGWDSGNDKAKSGVYFHSKYHGYFRLQMEWTSLPPLRGPLEAGVSSDPMYFRVVKGECQQVRGK